MPLIDNITIKLSCQQYESTAYELREDKSVIRYESTGKGSDAVCPYCKSAHCHIQSRQETRLKDMPVWFGTKQEADVAYHRYICLDCKRTFMEDIPFKYSEARITTRAARWCHELLSLAMSVLAVSLITGISQETVKKINSARMEAELLERARELRARGYKPTYLAVDEFAIHKGHRYATCVMDLEEGDIIWAGMGRSMDAFAKFFDDMDLDYLSNVKAVAMDMNASYSKLISKHLPWAEIVYDRYHMQAQFGKEVLGAVRLEEARRHQKKSNELSREAETCEDRNEAKRLKDEAKKESSKYSSLKASRWILLANGENATPERSEKLGRILEEHSSISLCYAMKEEMADLFSITDAEEARTRWANWFEGAKASGIQQLVRFALLKEARLEGLVAHASHCISTGKLEGFNNKIKVAKRNGYGYRDECYFFTLIRFLSIHRPKKSSHKNP